MASPRLGESEAIRGQSHSPSQRDASLSSIEISGLRPVAAGVVRGSGNFLEIAPEVPRAVRFLDWSASWCCRLEKTLFWSRSVDHDRPPNRTAMVWCTRMSALPWELTINRGEHVARSRRIVRQPRAGEPCPEPLRRDNTAVCREPIQMDPRRSTATGNPIRSTEPPVIVRPALKPRAANSTDRLAPRFEPTRLAPKNCALSQQYVRRTSRVYTANVKAHFYFPGRAFHLPSNPAPFLTTLEPARTLFQPDFRTLDLSSPTVANLRLDVNPEARLSCP